MEEVNFSPNQKKIARLLAQGTTDYGEIANKLGLARQTIKANVVKIKEKLDPHDEIGVLSEERGYDTHDTKTFVAVESHRRGYGDEEG